jgi:hypothetical protein
MSPVDASARSPAPPSTVDTWLQWFATEKQAAYRAYLWTRYHLDTLDVEARSMPPCSRLCATGPLSSTPWPTCGRR